MNTTSVSTNVGTIDRKNPVNTGAAKEAPYAPAGFQPETPVNVDTSVRSMLSMLTKAGLSEHLSAQEMPEEVQKLVSQILQNAFSLDSSLSQGIGNLLQGQKVSVEQLHFLAKIITQLGAAAEGEAEKFSDDLKALLSNLKLLDGQSGKLLDDVALNKLALQLLEGKSLAEMPELVQFLLSQGAGTAVVPQPSEEFSFLKQLVKIFLPSAPLEGAETQVQQGQQPQEGQQAQQNQQAQQGQQTQGGQQAQQGQQPQEGQQAQQNQPAQQGQQTPGGQQAQQGQQTQGGQQAQQNQQTQQAQQGQKAQQGQQTQAGQQTQPGQQMQAGQQAQTGAQPQENAAQHAQGEAKAQAGAQQQAQETAKPQAGAQQQDTEKPQPNAAQQAQADAKPQQSAAHQTADSAKTTVKAPDAQQSGAQGQDAAQTAKSGRQESAAQTPQSAQAQQNVQQAPSAQSNAAAQVMKQLAGQILQKAATHPGLLSQKDAALLKSFTQEPGKLPSEAEMKQLQDLARMSEANLPAIIRQAAMRPGMTELPRLWTFIQLCNLSALFNLPANKLKDSGKKVQDFATILRRAVQNENEASGNQRSISFMTPLYMGENERCYPTYVHVFHQSEEGGGQGMDKQKETWLRICLLTEHIGAAELIFHLYEGDHINLRVSFSEEDAVKSFYEYLPDMRAAFAQLPLELNDVKVGTIHE